MFMIGFLWWLAGLFHGFILTSFLVDRLQKAGRRRSAGA